MAWFRKNDDTRYTVDIRNAKYPDTTGKAYSRDEMRSVRNRARTIGLKLDVKKVPKR